jgi:hypothetical protein
MNCLFSLIYRWKGYPSEFNTWEPYSKLKSDAPDLVKTFKKSLISNKDDESANITADEANLKLSKKLDQVINF